MTSLGLLDSALRQFDGIIAGAYPTLMTDAKLIWLALVSIELGVIFWRAAQRQSLEGLLWDLTNGLLGAGVALAILQHSLEWGSDVVGLGEQLAVAAGGVSSSAVTPSGVVDQGFQIVSVLWGYSSAGVWWSHPLDETVLWIAGFITGVAFFLAGLVYFFTLLFTTFLVAWGCLVLMFTAVDWTWPILLRWVDQVLAVAIKLAVILLIVGGGLAWINGLAAQVNAGLASGRGVIWNFWGLMITFVALTFLAVIKYLPNYLSQVVAVAAHYAPSHGESWFGTAGSVAGNIAAAAITGGATEVGETAGALASKVRSTLTQ